jgi:predicted RNA-binding protein with PUA-like domain
MRFWIVKGKPSLNDLSTMLEPGIVEPWVTRKPPREWAAGDGIFFWKSAPALCILGLGRITAVHAPDENGASWFDLLYLTAPLEAPLTIHELRADPVVSGASFLKAGAAGTVFPLSDAQAERLVDLVLDRHPALRSFTWDATVRPKANDDPPRALSVRQPWADLIMRGDKTIEVRSIRTNIRDRVHVYASLGGVDVDERVRVTREYGLDIDSLPRGVLVGTVEIVGCRPLTVRDSRAAAFPVSRADTTNFAWLLGSPRRAAKLVKPAKHPQPVFFKPF